MDCVWIVSSQFLLNWCLCVASEITFDIAIVVGGLNCLYYIIAFEFFILSYVVLGHW